MISKEQALFDWAATNPFLTDRLLFDYLNAQQGSCSISPVASDDVVAEYIDGTKLRQYTFSFQVVFPISDTTDTVNIENMLTLRQWQNWVEDQQRLGIFPDFGPLCFEYELKNLNNMPSISRLYENGLAKYDFYAKLMYMELEAD